MYVCDVHHARPCTCDRYMDLHDVHHIRTYRHTLVDKGVLGRESEETEDRSTLITVYTEKRLMPESHLHSELGSLKLHH